MGSVRPWENSVVLHDRLRVGVCHIRVTANFPGVFYVGAIERAPQRQTRPETTTPQRYGTAQINTSPVREGPVSTTPTTTSLRNGGSSSGWKQISQTNLRRNPIPATTLFCTRAVGRRKRSTSIHRPLHPSTARRKDKIPCTGSPGGSSWRSRAGSIGGLCRSCAPQCHTPSAFPARHIRAGSAHNTTSYRVLKLEERGKGPEMDGSRAAGTSVPCLPRGWGKANVHELSNCRA